MKQEISELLEGVIKKNFDIELDEIKLENPPKKNLGDYAFGCFILSRELKKNPAEIAGDISKLLAEEDLVESATPTGPYINIKVNKNSFTGKFLDYMNSTGHPQGEPLQKKSIYIDYIGANVGKPLHIGHMCTPNQGQVMINVYKKLGYKVISDSHIGDWGIIFGKLITAFKKYGSEEKLHENAVEHLFELYVKITSDAESDETIENTFREEFKKLSHGDTESKELWSKFTKESILAMNIQLGRMNIKPDYNIGESFYEGLGLPKMEEYPDLKISMSQVVEELLDKNIATLTKNDDGTESVGVHFSEESKMPSCILQKRDGTHGYLASDLASIKYRKSNWNLEKIVYFVDARQQLHLQQTFEIAKQAGWLGGTELIHAYNGFISLKDGAMSTRKGRIIKLEKLLDEAEDRAEKIILEKRDDIQGEELKTLSKIIGIGAIKYGYLKKNRESDIIFDWDEFMSFEGNSGPYIQYAYVRARRILEKTDFVGTADLQSLQGEGFESSEEIELAKKIMNFRNTLEESIVGNYPHIITGYAYDLTKAFSSFYNNVRVNDEEDENKKQLRLLLVNSFAETLKETFGLLGIEMPEKM